MTRTHITELPTAALRDRIAVLGREARHIINTMKAGQAELERREAAAAARAAAVGVTPDAR